MQNENTSGTKKPKLKQDEVSIRKDCYVWIWQRSEFGGYLNTFYYSSAKADVCQTVHADRRRANRYLFTGPFREEKEKRIRINDINFKAEKTYGGTQRHYEEQIFVFGSKLELLQRLSSEENLQPVLDSFVRVGILPETPIKAQLDHEIALGIYKDLAGQKGDLVEGNIGSVSLAANEPVASVRKLRL